MLAAIIDSQSFADVPRCATLHVKPCSDKEEPWNILLLEAPQTQVLKDHFPSHLCFYP